VKVSDRRAAREVLARTAGVVSAEPAGDSLHVFLAPGVTLDNVVGLGERAVRRIEPSLEDVFIALIRKEEAGRK
jgi:hypothetical protein